MLLLGIAAEAVGRRTSLPRVTLLLMFGVLIGDGMLGIIPASVTGRFELIANLALMMIGFLLGGKLTVSTLSNSGDQLIWISASATFGTTVIVALALFLVGVPLEIAILLGCISAATAPAATFDTVMESGKESSFSRLLLGIVAVDDAWALIVTSLGLATVALLQGTADFSVSLVTTAREIFGAIILGGAIGLPAARLTGRFRPGQPMLTEALGLVLLCGGLAIWLEVSFLIATMTMGAVIANLAVHHEYAFHEIENIESPFLVIFFILAGASLELEMMTGLGLIGLVYIIARTGGKIISARFGAYMSHADEDTRHWMGFALLPQAGVAIGLSLVAISQFPEYRSTILPVVIGTTVAFELVGPIFTRMALRKAHQGGID